MFKIRRGDLVYVLAGDDRGKKGTVLKVFPKEKRAIVEGINYVKKHRRKRREDEPGGIVQIEAPIHISNLSIFCKRCNRAVKVGFRILEDGEKIRYCKRCKEML
jgi:large subunit ribosomal protein L24